MIYMLQFDQHLGHKRSPHASAEFYLGYCDENNLEKRLKEHRNGNGAAITRAAVEKGIGFRVVMMIEKATREDERTLKNRKNHRRVLRQWKQGTLRL